MKIIAKKIIADSQGSRVCRMEIAAAQIAEKALPGQFVVLMVSREGERIPLTIVESDARNGQISLIFQEAGLTTRLLNRLNPGDCLFSLVGPLGHPSEIKNYGRAIIIGGGVGIAEILPVTAALKAAGNHISVILGARTKGLLILQEELGRTGDEFYLTTDDGSAGRKGFTTDILAELLKKGRYDLVYAVGPIPMMQKVTAVTEGFAVKTIVSLNAVMVDASGMCGCCRVSVGGEVKFSCVDGPEFEAHAVNWDELAKRNKMYLRQEKDICKLLPK